MARAAKQKHYCICGKGFDTARKLWGHIGGYRNDPAHGEAGGSTPEEEPVVASGGRAGNLNRPSFGRQRVATAATQQRQGGEQPTYFDVRIRVPASIWMYFDAFRNYFGIHNTFSEWIVDCVLTCIEHSEYELMLVKKGVAFGQEGINGYNEEKSDHDDIDDIDVIFPSTRALTIVRDTTSGGDGYAAGDASDTAAGPDVKGNWYGPDGRDLGYGEEEKD